MITGCLPYIGTHAFQIGRQHLEDPIPQARKFVRNLPMEVDRVITTALAKEPKNRFPNMRSFTHELEKLVELGGMSVPRNVRKPKPKPSAMAMGRKTIIGVLIGIALVFLVGVGLAMTENLPAIFSSTSPTLSSTDPAATVGPTFILTRETIVGLTPTNTVAFTPTHETPTLIPVLEKVILPENADNLIEKNRFDGLSVISLGWVEQDYGLVDIGSGRNAVISFINPTTSDVIPVNLSEETVPKAMAMSQGKLYVLFNDNIKVYNLVDRKLLNTFSPIAGGANSIAASPDGNFLALGISNNKTQILQSANGSVVRNLISEFGGWAVRFSSDSKYVISGTSRGVLKWERESGVWQPITGGGEKIVKSLAVSPNGKLLAASGNGFINIWNMTNGELLFQITGEFGVAKSLDFSPNNMLLASGSDDNLVRIWDAGNGALLKELNGHTGQVMAVCFSPDGENIASGSGADTSIRIWGLP